MKSALVLLLAGSAAAFAPASQQATGSALNAVLDDMPGNTKPVGPWDPLNLATLGSESTLAWFRASEVKHSRIAMLATTGYLVQAAGFHFPGMLSSDVSFESLSTMKPFDAWCAVPALGKLSIFLESTKLLPDEIVWESNYLADLKQIISVRIFNFISHIRLSSLYYRTNANHWNSCMGRDCQ